MANEDVVLIHTKNGIGTLTLNRPGKRNAMNNILIEELTSAFEGLLEDKNIHVIMIAANGEHFCAGADIAWMQMVAQTSLEENITDAMLLANLLKLIHTSPKPTIALVHGASLGGGLGLITVCDIAIAADNASFAFSEVKIGITPSVISPYVIAAMGARYGRYYFLTGEKFDANDALRMGLVHQVIPLEELTKRGEDIANCILKNSPSAVTSAKKLISTVSMKEINSEIIQFSAEHLAKTRMTQEAKEGLQAFLEKRQPNWQT